MSRISSSSPSSSRARRNPSFHATFITFQRPYNGATGLVSETVLRKCLSKLPVIDINFDVVCGATGGDDVQLPVAIEIGNAKILTSHRPVIDQLRLP